MSIEQTISYNRAPMVVEQSNSSCVRSRGRGRGPGSIQRTANFIYSFLVQTTRLLYKTILDRCHRMDYEPSQADPAKKNIKLQTASWLVFSLLDFIIFHYYLFHSTFPIIVFIKSVNCLNH